MDITWSFCLRQHTIRLVVADPTLDLQQVVCADFRAIVLLATWCQGIMCDPRTTTPQPTISHVS